MSPARPSSETPRHHALISPLNSLRFVAALHLYWFHLLTTRPFLTAEAWKASPFSAFDRLPQWFIGWLDRGYTSTSLFFILSGFVLAYLYVDPSGKLTLPDRTFWRNRFARIYPTHLGILVLLTPLVIEFMQSIPAPLLFAQEAPLWLSLALGFLTSATLTQAWFPDLALSWNFPTWALSTVVFFYLVFPSINRWLSRRSKTQHQWILALSPVVSLIPPSIYLAVVGADQQMGGKPVPGDWVPFFNEFVMRTPLFWLPHFVMGILISRLTGVSRHGPSPESSALQPASRWKPSWGDLALGILFVILSTPDSTLATITGVPSYWFRLMLRHGTLAPLYWLLIRDLARNRGITAQLLAWRPLAKLGETSFALFLVQLPMIELGIRLSSWLPWSPPLLMVLLSVATLASAIGCTALERVITQRLRQP